MREAATLYYLQHETMESVAHALGLSRSAVSRLLKAAREAGIVRIHVETEEAGSSLARRLGDQFGVTVHVVPVREPITAEARLDRVARFAAAALAEWFGDGMTLGVAWGTTVDAVIGHLVPTDLTDAVVVQLNGSASPRAAGTSFGADQTSAIARAFNAQAQHFPVPAFFDFATTKELMWRERSVRQVLEVQARADLALFGIGALDAPVPSRVYSYGYLDEADRDALEAEGVVGDVCTVFLREDGTWRDVSVNARATGPTPVDLRRIGRRVAVASGRAKVPALLGALRAGAITDLVIDSGTAQAAMSGLAPRG